VRCSAVFIVTIRYMADKGFLPCPFMVSVMGIPCISSVAVHRAGVAVHAVMILSNGACLAARRKGPGKGAQGRGEYEKDKEYGERPEHTRQVYHHT